jgi:hypothetical protein
VVAICALALMMAVPTKTIDTGPSGVEVAMGQRVVAPDSDEPVATSTTTTEPEPGSTTTAPAAAPASMEKLLLVGDSIMRQIAPYFAEHYPDADVRWVGADGIGPLTEQGRILPLVEEAIRGFDPDVVLFEFAGSYTKQRGGEPFRTADGTEVEDGSDLMFDVWDQQCRLLVREARAKGAKVLWALAPPVDPDGYFKYLAPNITRFNRLYESLPSVDLVDWFSASAAEGGRYSAQLVGEGGEVEVARSPDGLHFTEFGYRQLVDAAADQIDTYDGRDDVHHDPRGRPAD